MSEKGLLNMTPPPNRASGHLVRNLFLGSVVLGASLFLSNNAYSQSEKLPAQAIDKTTINKTMEVETMPPVQMQKKKREEELQYTTAVQTDFVLELNRKLTIGKPNDANTLDRIITGDYFRITTRESAVFGGNPMDAFGGDRVGEFFLGGFNAFDSGKWDCYWKPSGASYYKEGQLNWIDALNKVRVYFEFDEGRTLTVGYDDDLNTKRTTVTRNFIKIKAVGIDVLERGVLEIDGNRVSELYMKTDGIDKMYYKPLGANYYREVAPENFLIVYDDKITTLVLDGSTRIMRAGSIFNNVQLYPNPANGTVTLHFELSGNNAQVRVTNSMGSEVPITQDGQKVLEVQGAGEKKVQLDVSQLSNGMYYVKIHDQTGQQTIMPLSVVK